MLLMMACTEEDKNSLFVSRNEISIASEGGVATVALQTDAETWKIINPADWITINPFNGNGPEATIDIEVNTIVPEVRTDTLTVVAGTATQDIIVTQAASEFIYTMSANYESMNFGPSGGTIVMEVTTNADDWDITPSVEWLDANIVANSQGVYDVEVVATANESGDVREATISLIAEYAPLIEIGVSQISEYYPSYNTSPQDPDETGMASTATELKEHMTFGINIGNTLEAIGGETAWGNPRISKTLIDAYKAEGFDAIRIPCSFDQHSNANTAKIDDSWLERVKEVVGYCIENELYVVLNIHWDGGWLENNINTGSQERVNAKQKAFWEQIATHLRDFDEHLIFASANEPHAENASQMAVLDTYHQTFVDAVRSTGGKNSYRVLVIQGPITDIDKTNELFRNFPTDEIPNKLMAEVHYYTPYQFCLMEEDADWGKVFYYWGEGFHSDTDTERNATWGEEADLNALFTKTHNQFVKKGYPVVLGEFGAYKRSNIPDQALHEASVDYFNKYVVQACQEYGFIPFYWDTGGLINRSSGAVRDEALMNALREGAGKQL